MAYRSELTLFFIPSQTLSTLCEKDMSNGGDFIDSILILQTSTRRKENIT